VSVRSKASSPLMICNTFVPLFADLDLIVSIIFNSKKSCLTFWTIQVSKFAAIRLKRLRDLDVWTLEDLVDLLQKH
jgi:hypothetical protein